MEYEKLNLSDGEIFTAEHLAHIEQGIADADCGIRRIVNEDPENKIILRDLETGVYVIYGYVEPFPNSNYTITCNNVLVHVVRKTAGSHLLCMNPLNGKLDFKEILVDDTSEKGFTYTRTDIDLLEMNTIRRTVYLTHPGGDFGTNPCEITTANGGMTIEEINEHSTNGVTGWVDRPVSVSADAAYCYAATSEYKDGVWSAFERCRIIAHYAE